MVAKIETGKSLTGALNYNERKVKAGKAILIAAQSYAKDVNRLSFDDKLFRLTDLAARNQRTRTNTLHLSLNFDVTENIGKEILTDIADAYMEKIGFGDQPYLVYRHFDAGHDHIHILSTNIEASGRRISMHNIAKLRSEPARKEIEKAFGLVQAEQHRTVDRAREIKPLVYGTTDTKRALTNVVNFVAQGFRFTSLPEFNAVLRTFNVMADRGPKETVMFTKGGLRYWALDETGQKVGVPIKASSIYKKPTLKLLEERFRLNEYLRKPFKEQLKAAIEKALTRVQTRDQLRDDLARKNIHILYRENGEGRVYGLTFIDQKNKVVFNGSDLGKAYSAAAVENRFKENRRSPVKEPEFMSPATIEPANVLNPPEAGRQQQVKLLDDLLGPVDETGNQNLFERKRKKKRRKLKL